MEYYNLHKIFGVYQIVNKLNNKRYIGSTTKSFKDRWRVWKNDLQKGNASSHIQNAWNKYGEDNFNFEIIEVVYNKALVLNREQYWMDTLKPEYNIRPLAENNFGNKLSEETKRKISLKHLGKKMSEESKLKMSLAKQGENHVNFGKSLSEETKEKIRQSNLGQKRSAETCKKIGQANLGRKLSEEHKNALLSSRLGQKNSNESKQKVSESLKRYHQNKNK